MNPLISSADAALSRILLRRAPGNVAASSIYAVLSVALALWAGKDLNWDLLNYHYHNGWALLYDRWDADIAPAQLQTWFNPLLDVPLAWSIRHLPPLLVGALYAVIQSLNAMCIRALALRTLPLRDSESRDWAAFAIGLASLTGAIYRAEVGGSMGDTLVSIALLGSLVLLARPGAQNVPPLSRWATAGLLAGAAAGLKLTMIIYVLGFGVAALAFDAPSRSRRLWAMLCFFSAAFAGWALFDGFWRLSLWQSFGNPVFPLMNQVFRSPFAAPLSFSDARFLPAAWWQALLYPLVWLLDPHAVSDSGRFIDLRLPLCYIVGIAWLIAVATRRNHHHFDPSARFLLCGSLLSYLLWLGLFGIYRYLAVLELLGPLLLAHLFLSLGWIRNGQRASVVAFFAIICLAVLPVAQTRGSWQDASYFDTNTPPAFRDIGDAIVLLGGQAPISFVLPELPENWRFLRIASNFQTDPMTHTELDRRIAQRIVHSTGTLLGLASGSELAQFDQELARWHLVRDPARPCDPIATAAMRTRPIPAFTQPLILCRLVQR